MQPGDTVTIYETLKTTNVNLNEPVVIVNSVEPADLETKKFYAAYGEYPQTYVGNAMNEVLKNASLTETGKTYTTEIMSEVVVLNEYSYGGILYAGAGYRFSFTKLIRFYAFGGKRRTRFGLSS